MSPGKISPPIMYKTAHMMLSIPAAEQAEDLAVTSRTAILAEPIIIKAIPIIMKPIHMYIKLGAIKGGRKGSMKLTSENTFASIMNKDPKMNPIMLKMRPTTPMAPPPALYAP